VVSGVSVSFGELAVELLILVVPPVGRLSSNANGSGCIGDDSHLSVGGEEAAFFAVVVGRGPCGPFLGEAVCGELGATEAREVMP
jgi:hypothetical protein